MEANNNTARKVIKCPHCGWEYEPGEIYLPDVLLGYPINVIRDALGHIIYTEYKPYKEPCSTEEFWCEHCDRPFVIEAEITYKSKPQDEELDFSNTTVSLF